MFEIYKFEFDNDFINQDELRSYIDMGLITQAEYQEIVGGTNDEREAQPTAQDQPPTTCNFGNCYGGYRTYPDF